MCIRDSKDLEKLSKQIEITITPEGLRIELIEGKDGTFFQSGSARLSDSGQELLALLAAELKTLPNSCLLYTSARPAHSSHHSGNGASGSDNGLFSLGDYRRIPAKPSNCFNPVSYTHLDVYKRQAWDWAWASPLDATSWPPPRSSRR